MFNNLTLALLLCTTAPGVVTSGTHHLISGDYNDLAFVKNRLYTASGFGLSVFAPELTLIQHIPTPHYSREIAVYGRKAWLGEGNRITLYKLSSKGPEAASEMEISGQITAMETDKDYLAAGTDSGKIYIIPHEWELKAVSSFDQRDEPIDLCFYEDYLFSASSKGIMIIRLGNTPEIVKTLNASSVNSIEILDEMLFVATSGNNILAYSLKDNPAQPVMIKEFSAGSPVVSMSGYDKLLYAAQGYNGYSIFTKNGKKIEGCEEVDIGFVADIEPTSEGTYLALMDHGLLRLEGKNPKSLSITSRYTDIAPSLHISQGGVFWGIAQGKGGVRILRPIGDSTIQGYANPRPADAKSSAISGSYLYVADAARGISIFTLKSLPSADREFDLSQPGTPIRVITSEDLIYLASESKGVRVLWICPCGPLAQKAAFENDIVAHDIAVKDTLIFVADPEAGILVLTRGVSKSKKTTVNYLSTYEWIMQPEAILLDEDVLYVTDSIGALIALDVSDPLSIEQLSFTMIGTKPYGLALSGESVYVACGEKGILPIDVSDPASPVKGTIIETPGKALSVAVSPTHLGIADYTSVLIVPLSEIQ
ncbi:hypothetical protein GF359_02305 [candidate division WOR-3 bacterium]|uniref:Uncharacterized protein n=1 Tax=candidate division WOR-3 bacterium TaxID=2052148 RepID=A0A9D5KA15_UNCW3|nr:hypothetical protein [candidate division WOR-3 bacterium]MBD3364026.1 hypothetical protein [candidate division WOR-3 bacterium]